MNPTKKHKRYIAAVQRNISMFRNNLNFYRKLYNSLGEIKHVLGIRAKDDSFDDEILIGLYGKKGI